MSSPNNMSRHHASQTQSMSRRHQGAVSKRRGRTYSREDVTLDDTASEKNSLDYGNNVGALSPMEINGKKTLFRSQSFGGRLAQILDNPTLKGGRVLVLVAACIYGSNFSIVKLLDDAMPLSISASLRFVLAAAVVGAVVLGKESDDVEPRVIKERSLAFWSGVEIGLWYCIGYIAQAEGLQTVAAGKSAFFNALAVVVVPILDVAVKGKVLAKLEVASVLIACVGVGLLELGPTGGLSISPGDVLAFMQTIFFGVGYWRLEDVSHTHNEQAARLTVGQLAAVALGSTVYAFSEYSASHLEISSTDEVMGWFENPFIFGALIWTGLISTALALYLETVALKVVSATELTLLMTTTSLWGAAFAFVTLGEVLTPTGMLGGLLIMGGCILGNINPAPGKAPSTADTASLLEQGEHRKATPMSLESTSSFASTT